MAEGLSRSDEEQLNKAFKAAALNNFPNPDRIGCPTDKRLLRDLAAKKLRPTDPFVQHVAECSPCFRELNELKHRSNSGRAWKITGAAAAIVLAGAAFWLWERRLPPLDGGERIATIDLRPSDAMRSPNTAQHRLSFSLSRGKLSVSILLPVGAAEGPYELKLLNDALQPVWSGQSEASLRNHVMIISTKIDTRDLNPGTYSFWLRRPGHEWQDYPVDLR